MPSVRQRLIPVVIGAVLLVSSGPTPAQQAPEPSQATDQAEAPGGEPQEPQPTFRTGVNFVRVDVIVSDGESEPVTDLTAQDFEVFEDGELQSIEQFRLIRVDGNPRPGEGPPRQIRSQFDEETEAAREDVRLFLIFLDDYHVRLTNAMAIREPLTRFIETALRPTDMVAVMYPLTPVEGIRFTRNHASIVRAIQEFEGRKFRYEPRNQFEEQYVRAPTETVERIRNQVVMSALEGAAVRLGSLREGRSSVLFVSEGFTVMLPPQLRNESALFAAPCVGGLGGACGSTVGANNPTEQRARAAAESDLYLRMRDVYTAANRNNMAVYSVDPRGLATGEFDIDENVGPDQDRELLRLGQNTLRALSEETDGRAIVNRNDLAGGLAQVVRDASAYYLLGYTSSAEPTDGRFHEITVRVKRRGLDVRARNGYWAFTAADAVLAEAPSVPSVPSAVQQALAAIATSARAERYVRTWVGTDRAENGKTRVSVVFEAIPSTEGPRREQPGGVSLLAATEQGDLIFRGRSGLGPSGGTGAGTAITFEADPGSVELRLSVEAEGGGGTLDNEIRMIAVPDLTASGDGLSTPRVHRARNALEFRTLAGDATAVPVASRNFSRTERLLIRFDVYNGGVPRATLLNRGGEPMAELTVVPAVAGGTHQIDLGLNSVPPGEYLVEIVAQSPSGEDASELFAVRVSS